MIYLKAGELYDHKFDDNTGMTFVAPEEGWYDTFGDNGGIVFHGKMIQNRSLEKSDEAIRILNDNTESKKRVNELFDILDEVEEYDKRNNSKTTTLKFPNGSEILISKEPLDSCNTDPIYVDDKNLIKYQLESRVTQVLVNMETGEEIPYDEEFVSKLREE